MTSFEFAGTNLETYGLALTGLPSFPGRAAAKRQQAEFVSKDGAKIRISALYGKEIVVNCAVKANNYEELITQLDAIHKLLDPSNGEGLLVFEHDRVLPVSLSRGYNAVCLERIDQEVGQTLARMAVRFYVPSGKAVSLTEQEKSQSIAATTQTFYTPVVYGNGMTKPDIAFVSDDAGTGLVLNVKNETTEKEFTITDPTFGSGDSIAFCGETFQLRKTPSGSAEGTNVVSYLNREGESPDIIGGAANQFFVESDQTGTMTINFTGAFLT